MELIRFVLERVAAKLKLINIASGRRLSDESRSSMLEHELRRQIRYRRQIEAEWERLYFEGCDDEFNP
jgi:hypothetical protein